ncbi:hypothetical protein [Saccharothrix longispora]|nr:hypothetical protein [Saccharothrix longispora]MDU0289761.1 hypothetical protein [Saccharothrix longispora]
MRVDDRQARPVAVEAHAARSAGAKHGIVVGPGGFTVVDRGRG